MEMGDREVASPVVPPLSAFARGGRTGGPPLPPGGRGQRWQDTGGGMRLNSRRLSSRMDSMDLDGPYQGETGGGMMKARRLSSRMESMDLDGRSEMSSGTLKGSRLSSRMSSRLESFDLDGIQRNRCSSPCLEV